MEQNLAKLFISPLTLRTARAVAQSETPITFTLNTEPLVQCEVMIEDVKATGYIFSLKMMTLDESGKAISNVANTTLTVGPSKSRPDQDDALACFLSDMAEVPYEFWESVASVNDNLSCAVVDQDNRVRQVDVDPSFDGDKIRLAISIDRPRKRRSILNTSISDDHVIYVSR